MVAALVPQIDTVTLATPAVTDMPAVTEMPAVTDMPAATNFEKPSPTSINVPAMGSSRSTGGLFRGRAYGNVPNHADFDANFATTLELGRPTKGEVCLYVTDQYPRDLKFESLKGHSEMVVMVKVVESMAPILAKVANKCSIIQSECACFISHFQFIKSLKYKLDPDCHIYLRKSTKWIALGSFDQAVDDDDDCEWGVSEEDTPELHLLIVSLLSIFKFRTFHNLI